MLFLSHFFKTLGYKGHSIKNSIKLLAIVSILLTSLFSRTTYATNDKTLHFGASSVAGYIAETTLHSSSLVNNSDFKRVVYGTALGSVPGLIKEIIDSNEENNHFSGDDMVANVAGAFVGSFIASKVNNHLNISLNKESDAYSIALVYRD